MIGLDVILGGITGLIGNIVTGVMNYKTLKIKMSHEAKMVALNTAAMKEEAKMKIAIKKTEIEGAVELADSKAYSESITVGNKQLFSDRWIDKLFSVRGFGEYIAVPAGVLIAILFGFVDWMRGLMRPALTAYLTGMSTVITYMAWDLLQKNGISMTTTQAVNLYTQTTSIVIYLTVSCVTWWFGDRRMAKFLTQLDLKGLK